MGEGSKPKKLPFYITFARQLCDDIHIPGGFSTFQPTPLSFTHTNSQPSYSHARKSFHCFFRLFVCLFVHFVLSSVAPSHYKRPLTTSKGQFKNILLTHKSLYSADLHMYMYFNYWSTYISVYTSRISFNQQNAY